MRQTIKIFISEHSPEIVDKKFDSFWAMISPAERIVEDINDKEFIKSIIKDVYNQEIVIMKRLKPKIEFPRAVFFEISNVAGDTKIYKGHIDKKGEVDVIHSLS